jgi:hypothetical protein
MVGKRHTAAFVSALRSRALTAEQCSATLGVFSLRRGCILCGVTALSTDEELIEHLRGLVAGSSLADDAKKSASAALDGLFDCFDTIDTALHATDEAKQKIDYADHEPKIETAIGTLKDLAKGL